jgi:hypothetical protein
VAVVTGTQKIEMLRKSLQFLLIGGKMNFLMRFTLSSLLFFSPLFSARADWSSGYYVQPSSRGMPTSHWKVLWTLSGDGSFRRSGYKTGEVIPQDDLLGKWEIHPNNQRVVMLHFDKGGTEYYLLGSSDFTLYAPKYDGFNYPSKIIQEVLDGSKSVDNAILSSAVYPYPTSFARKSHSIADCWEGFANPSVTPNFPKGYPYIQIWSDTHSVPSTHSLKIYDMMTGHGPMGSFPYSGPPIANAEKLIFREGIILQEDKAIGSYSMSPTQELILNLEANGISVRTLNKTIEIRFGNYTLQLPNRCLAHPNAFYNPRK